jgi:allantoicase
MATEDFTRLVDLATARLGGSVLWANDDFFAAKENLILPAAPRYDHEAYTDRGKEMDGWESRRRRVPGHDTCLLRLALPGIIRGVVVDTAFFRGNYPESCSLDGCVAPPDVTPEDLLGEGTEWVEILPRSPLQGDSRNPFAIAAPWRFTHLRFHIYPDGGVARLRVHGQVVPDWPEVLQRAAANTGGEVDLLAVEHGGGWLAASDMFYSSPGNLLMPGRGVRMDDGWETKRRRGPGHDWCVLRLGIPGSVARVVVDTAHFKGNYPDTCTLEGCVAPPGDSDHAGWPWRELVQRTKLAADAIHELPSLDGAPITHARLSIYPDGGVSRLRLLGTPSPAGLAAAAVARLDAMLPRAAAAAFAACCGSPEWTRRMEARRPFGSAEVLLAAAEEEWAGVGPEEWLAAFRAHPEIGARQAEVHAGATAAAWSAGEQAGVADADASARAELAEANRSYRERFGHIFIVCATGKSLPEMLANCRERLGNDPAREVAVAAEEQRQITRLRLVKLLGELAGAPVAVAEGTP